MQTFTIKIFRYVDDEELENSRIKTEYDGIYEKLLVKYEKSLQTMSEIDREAFKERLYVMAKREVIPYGPKYWAR